MDRPDMMPPPLPHGSYEINSSQYFTTVGPEPPQPTHEYYSTGAHPQMPPPPLPEPHHEGTTSNVLDPLLHQQGPLQPTASVPAQAQTSEAIIDAAKAERTAQDRERGRLRVQRFRLKRKLADAEAGKRDKDTLKKIKFPADEQDSSNGAGPSAGRRGPSIKDTEAEMRERERGRLRVQAYRMRKKLAEAKDGVRDPSTLKKIRTGKNGEPDAPQPIAQPPSYQSGMLPPDQDPLVHYQDSMFNVPVEAPPTMLPPPPLSAPPTSSKAETLLDPDYAPTAATALSISTPSRQRAVRTNWFHPTRWSTINAAGLRANFSSAHEIVRLAKLAPGGEEIFKTLDRGTVHKWIDKERGAWSESVLEKVRKAAVKEAESWEHIQGQAADKSGGGDELQIQTGMSVYGPPPGLEGISPELVGVPGAVPQFQGDIGAGEHEAGVMGGAA